MAKEKEQQEREKAEAQKRIERERQEKTNSQAANQSDPELSEKRTERTANPSTQWENGGIDRSQLPEFIRTNDGKYYHKQGEVIQEVDYDQYMRLKHQRVKEQEQASKQVLSPAEQKKAVDNIMNKIKADQQRQYEVEQQMNQKISLMSQSMLAGQQIGETKEQLAQNSQLQDTYESVEQLMSDYNAKLGNVENLMEQLSAQRQQQINAVARNLSIDSDPNTAAYSQAMGDAAKMIGDVVAHNKAQKERKLAYEELERQKNEAITRIEAEKRRILSGARNDLFQRFKEGPVPTSSTKLETDSIFYFGYYTPADVGVQDAILQITTIYPVYRYGDGTWPYKENIHKDVFVSSTSPGILHGYYRNRAEAEAMRQALVKVYSRTGGSVKQIILKPKTLRPGTHSDPNFWEDGKSVPPINKTVTPNSNDDFWNN